MSRIGKQSIALPKGVTVQVDGQQVTVKGPKGELSFTLHPHTSLTQTTQEDGVDVLEVTVENDQEDSAIWGTMRAIVNNMVTGVTEGWSKGLELNGVGFKMNVQGKKLVMSLGFSHDVEFELPEGIEASIEGNVLTISGIDRQLVGRVAAEIRALKKPEPYKGKGFRYVDEIIRRKVGKAAKTE